MPVPCSRSLRSEPGSSLGTDALHRDVPSPFSATVTRQTRASGPVSFQEQTGTSRAKFTALSLRPLPVGAVWGVYQGLER